MAGSWLQCLDQVRAGTRVKTTFSLHAAVEAEQALATAVLVEVDNAPGPVQKLEHHRADVVEV
jgi:hypothetical protein